MASFSVGKHLTDSVMVIFVSVKAEPTRKSVSISVCTAKNVDRLYRIAYYVV